MSAVNESRPRLSDPELGGRGSSVTSSMWAFRGSPYNTGSAGGADYLPPLDPSIVGRVTCVERSTPQRPPPFAGNQ